jgi:hypothetical protein
MILVNYIIIKDRVYFFRKRGTFCGAGRSGFIFFKNDICTKINTLIAYKNSWPSNEFTYLMLALAAK